MTVSKILLGNGVHYLIFYYLGGSHSTMTLWSKYDSNLGVVNEYTVPKGLLCDQSPVFAAMFEGGFRETQEQIVDLEEIEDGSRLEASYG